MMLSIPVPQKFISHIVTTNAPLKMFRGASKVGMYINAHSDKILLGSGIVGGIASTALACYSTTKIDTILSDLEEEKQKIEYCAGEDAPVEISSQYSPEDAANDLRICQVKTCMRIAKLYAPSVILGAASIGCVLASHGIMARRGTAMAALCAATEKSFSAYRNNVVERFGEEVDHELEYGIIPTQVKEVVLDEETGKNKKIKKVVPVVDGAKLDNIASNYACFFDEGCSNWQKSRDYNITTLKLYERFANEKLIAKGYLFLSDVYEMLGIPGRDNEVSRSYGWVYDPHNPNFQNHVDFNLQNVYSDTEAALRDEPSMLLDFNPDGNIISFFEEYSR